MEIRELERIDSLEIQAVNVGMKFKNRVILDNQNITFQSGKLTVITGPSGSGKSTLLAILGGYMKPTIGHVKIGEKDITGLKEKELALLHANNIGYLPQWNVMLKKSSVLENVILPAIINDEKKHEGEYLEKAIEHLNALGIEEQKDNYPYELSGGELKRASLARALIMEPDILIADEPTTGLDAVTATRILEYMADYTARGKTVIIATHDDKAHDYADVIYDLAIKNVYNA